MATDTAALIGIGFCQPKFYKPSVWRKAKAIMEWLCDNTSHVERFDYGRGGGKYRTRGAMDEKSLFEEAIPELTKLYDSRHVTA